MRREDPTIGRHDGSAGDADYGAIGAGYSAFRQPQPAIGARVAAALGPAGAPLVS